MGYDAGKKIKGRKLHALVDTEGLPMRIVVHSAGIAGSRWRRAGPCPHPTTLPLAGTGLGRWRLRRSPSQSGVAAIPALRVEIVKRTDDVKGFMVLPRRWVVERTFSWFGRNRRLAKDYENLADTLAAFVTLAAIRLALRQFARTSTFKSG